MNTASMHIADLWARICSHGLHSYGLYSHGLYSYGRFVRQDLLQAQTIVALSADQSPEVDTCQLASQRVQGLFCFYSAFLHGRCGEGSQEVMVLVHAGSEV